MALGLDFLGKDKGYAILIILFLIITPFLLTPWVHGSDGLGYYMIMRSFWIDGDLDFSDEISIFQQKFSDLNYPKSAITGLHYTHYGIGNALLWTPFFGAAHLWVKLTNGLGSQTPADGFSFPYVLFVSFGSSLLAFIGILLTYYMLRQYFSLKASMTASLMVWFASPLTYYMYFSPTVSHAPSFFAMTLFIWYWFITRKDRTLRQWVFLGLIGSLVFIVRQEDAMVMIFPAIGSLFLYTKKFKKKKLVDFELLKNNIIFLGTFIIGILPQFIFFKHTYGDYFVTGQQLEKHSFDLMNLLHVHKILFAPDHGLFLWVPVTIVAIIGWYYFYRKDNVFAINCIVSFLLFLFFTAAVKQWMAIASFSTRHYVGVFAIFAFGIAALIDHFKKMPFPYVACTAAFFILYNFNLLIPYGSGLIGIQDPFILSNVLYNTIYELPKKILSIAYRFLFSRGSFITP
jgi:hypothetical protein